MRIQNWSRAGALAVGRGRRAVRRARRSTPIRARNGRRRRSAKRSSGPRRAPSRASSRAIARWSARSARSSARVSARLAGAGVGTYMDRQEAKLRAELERTGVSVTRIGDNITLNMPGNITFATNSADLNANFFEVLNSVSIVLNEFDQTVIEVAGHTDSTGSRRLQPAALGAPGERRGVVPRHAQRPAGLASSRSAMGEARPVATNDTDAGRQQNRRVELTLVPLTLS